MTLSHLGDGVATDELLVACPHLEEEDVLGAILLWARMEGRVVLTSDLDFGTSLATTGASKPSVVQLRTRSTLSARISPPATRVPREAEADSLSGALVTVEDDRVRLRPLTFDVNR